MSKQAAILKLATKWAKTKIPDYYSWAIQDVTYHRACARKYCGKRILRILEQKEEK